MLESLSPTTSRATWTPKSASCKPAMTTSTGARRRRSCSRHAWKSATAANSASSSSHASEVHVRYAASVATIATAADASARLGSSRSSCRTDATLAEARVRRRAAEATVISAQRAAPRRPGRVARHRLYPARRHERKDGHLVLRRVLERDSRRRLLDTAQVRLLLRLSDRLVRYHGGAHRRVELG